MPINPNIALGAQQQPVNMLGQVGQMLALKAATDEMRSNEEMRNLFAGGANFDDPEFQRRGYAANPKAFQELLGKRATTQKTQMEALKDEIALRRDALNNVSTPEDYLKWHEANHTGRLGAFFKSAGINPSRESIVAQLSQPGGLDKLKRASALGATQLEKELMQTERSVKVANIGAASGHRQANIAEQKFKIEEQQQADIAKILSGGGIVSTAPMAAPTSGGGGAVAPMTGAPVVAPTAPLASGAVSAPVAGGQVNALAPTTAPTPNVNALAGGDARQQIAAIDARINALMPLGAKAAPVIQALIGQKNSILTDEKNKYGEVRELQGIDPDTGKPTTYLGRFNNLTQRYEPIPMEEPPISVGGAGGSTSSQLNVAKPPQKPTPFQSSLGTEQAKDVVANRKVAQDAASIIETNEIGRKILNSGAITGAGANFFVGLNQALKTAGIDLGYGDASANSQAYVALMAQNTGKIIKQFGAGTGLSDADREYAAKAAAGQITLDEKAIRRVLDINDRASRNVIKLHNESVKGIKSDIPLTVEIPKSGRARVFSAQEQQALEWADANPRDPRAAQIRQRLGM